MDRNDPAYRGQADYGRGLLRVYDRFVLGFMATFVWRCPSGPILDNYRRHIREPHLDVGPGTGSFVDRSGLPDGARVTILDPNATVLEHASHQLRRLDVESIQADVLKPLPVGGPFASAGLNLVIHCLPGPIERKAGAVRNVAAVLGPHGVLFGSSVLGLRGPQTVISREVLRAFNRRGAFDNLDDTADGLRGILAASFEHVELKTVGSVAIFAASLPRSGAASQA